MSSSEAEKKIIDFIKKYGYDGYFELFISNYLYELIQYILHSESKGKNNLINFYYSDGEGNIRSSEEVKLFETILTLSTRSFGSFNPLIASLIGIS